MPYTANIPMATDFLSISQGQIQANFNAIADAFNRNHVVFNSVTPLQGKHAFVEMPNQSTAPAMPPLTIADEVGLYCNSSSLTSQPELFFIKQAGSTAPANLIPDIAPNGYPITASNYIAQNGWTRLPSGILLMWGNVTTFTNSTTVTLPISASIPNFYTIYQVFITSTGHSGSGGGALGTAMALGAITQPTNGGSPTPGIFTIFGSAAGVAANYLVIGV